MNYLRAALLPLALFAASVPSQVSAQSGSETISVSGMYGNDAYHAVTINYDAGTITFHLNNGAVFTPSPSDPSVFWAMVKMIMGRVLDGN